MSMFDDLSREDLTKVICEKLKKIMLENEGDEKVIVVVKKLGLEILDELPSTPRWAIFYYALFRQ